MLIELLGDFLVVIFLKVYVFYIRAITAFVCALTIFILELRLIITVMPMNGTDVDWEKIIREVSSKILMLNLLNINLLWENLLYIYLNNIKFVLALFGILLTVKLGDT